MKVAILRRNGFGDLLAAFPLMALIRERYPESEITLFVEERNAKLCPYLNLKFNFIVLKSRGNKYFQVFKAVRYRKMGFDLAISAKTSPMKLANLFLFAIGAKKRVAYVKKSWDSFLINEKRENEMSHLHQALKGLKLLDPSFQEIPSHLFPSLSLPKELLAKHPYPCDAPKLLISASTTQANNRLNPATYGAILNEFVKENCFKVFIISEKNDELRASEIERHLNFNSEIIVPTSFDHFIALLSQGDLAFFSDGGAAHIAAALGIPLLALFGGVDPKLWAPLSEKCRVLYHPEDVNQLKGSAILCALIDLWQKMKPKILKENLSQSI